eukprot:385119-Rhodomonas_salina.2
MRRIPRSTNSLRPDHHHPPAASPGALFAVTMHLLKHRLCLAPPQQHHHHRRQAVVQPNNPRHRRRALLALCLREQYTLLDIDPELVRLRVEHLLHLAVFGSGTDDHVAPRPAKVLDQHRQRTPLLALRQRQAHRTGNAPPDLDPRPRIGGAGLRHVETEVLRQAVVPDGP